MMMNKIWFKRDFKRRLTFSKVQKHYKDFIIKNRLKSKHKSKVKIFYY